MKIVYLTTSCFETGGIGRYSRYQIRAIRELFGKENIKVMSLLGADENSLETPFHVDYRGGKSSVSNKLKFIYAANKLIKDFSPDFVHAAHINLCALTNYFAKKNNAKSILNIYGHEVWSKFRYQSEKGLRNADIVMADCHFTAKYVEENGYREKKTTSVIWDCVDLERFHVGDVPSKLLQKYKIKHPKENFNILTLGRISTGALHKGYDRLLSVFENFSKLVPNTQLIYVGGGDYLDTLKASVAGKDLNDKVVFTGRIPEEELTDIYRCATIFSLVSDRGFGRGEGIPLTPIEAMACGVPIVVGNHDGSQEAVDNSKNGWVIDPFDLDAHLEIFLNAYNDRNVLKSKIDNIENILHERFSYKVFRDKHKALYGILD